MLLKLSKLSSTGFFFFFFFLTRRGGGGGGAKGYLFIAKQAVEFPQVLASFHNIFYAHFYIS